MSLDTNKILIAMSGGVDSSVAAAYLTDRGYEVIGVSMNLFSCDREIDRSCCSARDRMDARGVCELLGIKHYVVDYRDRFKKDVIDPFIDDYVVGRTPSPCILCNERLKFGALFEEADRLGAAYVATGHYARISNIENSFRLLRGSDPKKDQSYFLFPFGQSELSRIIFPIGDLSKDDVRRRALELSLPTRAKPESQEICFVPDDDYVAFLEERAGAKLKGPGDFVNISGEIVGRHRGIHAYTIGQRRGLGFGIGRRQYVVRIDWEKNEVVLGSPDDLMRKDMFVRDIKWCDESEAVNRDAIVRIRSTHFGNSAKIELIDRMRARILFKDPVRAIAPGQAAVFYDGDAVIGGGWIE